MDLEADVTVWAIKRLRDYLFANNLRIFTDHESLQQLDKVGEHSPRVRRWIEFITTYRYTIEYRKGNANGNNADLLSSLLLPAAEHAHTGSTLLTPPDDAGTYIVHSRGPQKRDSPTSGVGLGGRVSPATHSAWGGIPLTATNFQNFLEHGPQMTIKDLASLD